MKKYNPFSRYKNVDDDNYLKIRIELLKSDDLPDSFNRTIDTLLQIKNNLLVINKIGRINESGGRTYYLQAVQWLNGEIALSSFVSVPQVINIDDIDESLASLFEQYVHSVLSAFRAEPMYNQVEVTAAVSRATNLQSVEEELERALRTAEAKAGEVSDNTLRDINSTASSVQEIVRRDLEGSTRQLGDYTEQSLARIREDVDIAIGKLQQAVALDDWGVTYDADISDYEQRLNGMKWANGTVSRNLLSLVAHIKKIKWSWRVECRNLLVLPWRILILITKNVSTSLLIFKSKFISYKFQRIAWFSLLGFFVALYVYMTLISTRSADSLSAAIGVDNNWYTRLTIYLPIVIIIGIAYSFAVKNYRIYSNMIDQYRHRRTVAKTSQGIILSLSNTENETIRNEITAAAARALFEHRTTGHLTKKEADSMSPLDFLRVFSK